MRWGGGHRRGRASCLRATILHNATQSDGYQVARTRTFHHDTSCEMRSGGHAQPESTCLAYPCTSRRRSKSCGGGGRRGVKKASIAGMPRSLLIDEIKEIVVVCQTGFWTGIMFQVFSTKETSSPVVFRRKNITPTHPAFKLQNFGAWD